MTSEIRDEYFVQALREITNKTPDAATFAKALVDGDGNDSRTRALYIKYHSQWLQDQANIVAARNRKEQQKSDLKTKAEIELIERNKYAEFTDRYPGSSELEYNVRESFFAKYCSGERIDDEIANDIAEERRRRVSSAKMFFISVLILAAIASVTIVCLTRR